MEFTVLTAPRDDVRSLFDVCLSARPGVCKRFLPPLAVAVFRGATKSARVKCERSLISLELTTSKEYHSIKQLVA